MTEKNRAYYPSVVLAQMDDFICQSLFQTILHAYSHDVYFEVKLHQPLDTRPPLYTPNEILETARLISQWHYHKWKLSKYSLSVMDHFIEHDVRHHLQTSWASKSTPSYYSIQSYIACAQELLAAYLITLHPASEFRIQARTFQCSSGKPEGDVQARYNIPRYKALKQLIGLLSPLSIEEGNFIYKGSHNSIIWDGSKTYILAGPIHFINGANKNSSHHNVNYATSRAHSPSKRIYVKAHVDIKAGMSLGVDYGSDDMIYSDE